MKEKTKNGFKLLILFMMSILLISVAVPGIQLAYADDDTASSDTKDSSSTSKYKNLMVPSILSTAYADGLKLAASSSESNDSNSTGYDNFYANVNNILAYQNTNGQHIFSNVGTLFGQVGMSSGSSTNDIASLSSITKKELDARFSVGNDKLGLAYLNFGNAYTNLVSHAEKRKSSSVGVDSIVTGISATSGQVANIGVSILKMFSPAPVIMAFRDSSVISDSQYDDNKLIKIIRETDAIGDIVRFFGDPAPGFPMISNSDMIVVSIIVFTIGLSLLSIFLNGRQFGMTVRKVMVKILVVAIAIPLSARLFDFGMGLLNDTVSEQATSSERRLISSNLLLGPWVSETKFGIPSGTTLNIRDGEFALTSDDIYNINMYIAKQSGVIRDVTDKDAEKKVAKYIKSAVIADNNTTTVGWTNLTRSSTKTPWKTDKLLQIADALGNNQDVNADVKIGDIGYLTEGGLISTPDGSQFSQSGVSAYGFGLTPIAAFNIINTTFNSDKLSVKSNLVNNLTVPTVAVGANMYMYSDANGTVTRNRTMNPLIKMILNLVMLLAALTALARIFSAGFGGIIHGGASSALGSAAGWGELMGAVIALIGGVLGLSLLITIVNGVMDSIWNMLMTLVGMGKDLTIDDFMSPDIADKLGSFPIIGAQILEMMSSVFNFILSLISLFVLPKLIKIPIEAFGTWASELPGYLSEKAQAMENKFTGDYRADGNRGGNRGGKHLANAAAKAASKSQAQRQAIKTGAAMIGGTTLNHMLSNNKNDSVTGDTNSEDMNTDGLTPPNGSVAEKPIDKKKDEAMSTTNANETVDGNMIEETNIDGNDESNESQESQDSRDSQESIDDSNNLESVTAGDVEESVAQSVSNDAPVEGGALDSITEEASNDASAQATEAGALDSITEEASNDASAQATEAGALGSITDESSNDASAQATEGGVVASAIDATSENSVTDASKIGDSLQSEESSQNVQTSNEHDSVTKDIEGGKEVNSYESASSSVESLNNATVEASQVASNQSVSSQGGAERSNKDLKTASSMSQSSKATSAINANKASATSATSANKATNANNATKANKASATNATNATNANNATNTGGKSKTANNAFITGNNDGSSMSNAKRAQVSSRASRMADGIRNNSVLKNVTGTAKGDVTAREQAAMGAAYIVAGMVGAQGVTQHGVDNLNRRPVKTPTKETKDTRSGQKMSTGMQTRDEMLTRQPYKSGKLFRHLKQSDGRPTQQETNTKTKSESRGRRFFETVSDKTVSDKK